MSGQDELNPVLWLATHVGEMALSCLLRIERYVPQENKKIYHACSLKMDIGLVHFFYDPDSVLVHKHAKKDWTRPIYIQLSWPYSRSVILHIYYLELSEFFTLGKSLEYAISLGVWPSLEYILESAWWSNRMRTTLPWPRLAAHDKAWQKDFPSKKLRLLVQRKYTEYFLLCWAFYWYFSIRGAYTYYCKKIYILKVVTDLA